MQVRWFGHAHSYRPSSFRPLLSTAATATVAQRAPFSSSSVSSSNSTRRNHASSSSSWPGKSGPLSADAASTLPSTETTPPVPGVPQYNSRGLKNVVKQLSLNQPGQQARPVNQEAKALLDLVDKVSVANKKLAALKLRRDPLGEYRKARKEKSKEEKERLRASPILSVLKTDTLAKSSLRESNRWVDPLSGKMISAAKEAIAEAARSQHPASGATTTAAATSSLSRSPAVLASAVANDDQITRTTSPDIEDVGIYNWSEMEVRKDLSHWDKQRLEWLRKKNAKDAASSSSTSKPKSSETVMDYEQIYSDITNNRGLLAKPVPLYQFLSVLVDVWYEDGVFLPPSGN